MTTVQSLIAELAEEGAATRRVLERVPEDKLGWAPHAKSMSLGQLSQHVAVLPGALAEFLSESPVEAPTVPLPQAVSVQGLLSTLDASLTTATQRLTLWGDGRLNEEWTMTRGGRPILVLPRLAMVRSIMLNHWYHHRGQLTVYLRLLDVPLPPIYGPTADEDPFA